MLIKLAEYAARHGVSPQAVRKAINTGRLQRSVQREGKSWWIDPEVADIEWGRNTAPEFQRSKDAINAGKKAARGEGEPMPPVGPPVGKGGATYASAKAAAEGYKAMLLKLDYEERAKKLVSTDVVKARLFTMSRQVRDALLRIPPIVVDDLLASLGVEATAEQRAEGMLVLQKQITQALEGLQDAG
jgi:hypothetical protein